MTTVSVVIPVHGITVWLPAAVASIHAAPGFDVEILVVDDGCPDPVELEPSALSDVSLRILRQDHLGAGAARNEGVRHSEGSILMFLDADDLWKRGKVEIQAQLIEAEPDAIHCAWVEEFSSFAPAELPPAGPRERLLKGPSIITTAVRKDVALDIGPFPEDLRAGENIDWFLRAEGLGIPIRVHPEILAERRIHSGNRDRRSRPDSADYLTVIRRHRMNRSAPSSSPEPPKP
jgi:glycosyltransferase involved in cell wall biosynthesis